MSATNQWRVDSPALNTEYAMPNGFWVIPNNATSVTVQWNAFKADGTGAATVTVTLATVDEPAGTDKSTQSFAGVNGATHISSLGNNGTQVRSCSFKITAAPSGLPDHCLISMSAYTGSAYTLLKVRRGAAWSGVSGDKILVRRGGAWVQVNQVLARRTGAWASP